VQKLIIILIINAYNTLLQKTKEKNKNLILSILGSHLNNGLRRMGDLIFSEYKQYFKNTSNTQYWRNYNKKYKDILDNKK